MLTRSFTAVYDVLLSMLESPAGHLSSDETNVQELSTVQTSIIQSMLSERNTSCVFNMMVEEIRGA
jgi:hypothetical protein